MRSHATDVSRANSKIETHWLNGAAARSHGTHCSCRQLALALGLRESALDYNYCFHVLQRHWRVRCDHLPESHHGKTTPNLPPHDMHDPVHVLLIANADAISTD